MVVRKVYKDFDYQVINNMDWNVSKSFDILYVQRPYEKSQLEAIKIAKLCRMPVWIDYDDDFLNTPMSNLSYPKVLEGRETLIECIKLADLVTVSTNKLKDVYEMYSKNVFVINNTLDDSLLTLSPEYVTTRQRRILWRGWLNHRDDVKAYEDQIVAQIVKHSEYTFTFIGDVFPAFAAYKNVEFLPEQGLLQYFQLLKKLEPCICMVPLESNAFNLAKSNIAWIEATYAGAITLAPNMEEWKQPGVSLYNSSKGDFGFKLNKLIENQEIWSPLWNHSATCIREKFLLSDNVATYYGFAEDLINV